MLDDHLLFLASGNHFLFKDTSSDEKEIHAGMHGQALCFLPQFTNIMKKMLLWGSFPLFLTTSIAGRAKKEREILYDGEVRLFEGKQGRVQGITSCFVYELRFRNAQESGSMFVDAEFIVELAYHYQDASGGNMKNIKKFSCHQRLYPNIPGLSDKPSDAGQLFVTPMVRDVAYRYERTGDGLGIHLIISASLEYIATFGYYSSIYECGTEQPEPGHSVECINWQSVFDHIEFEDALACLESLIRLIKIQRLFGEQGKTCHTAGATRSSETDERSRRLKEHIKTLEERVNSCRMNIAHLQSQLREREEIISKLLVLLDKGEKRH